MKKLLDSVYTLGFSHGFHKKGRCEKTITVIDEMSKVVTRMHPEGKSHLIAEYEDGFNEGEFVSDYGLLKEKNVPKI
jgi:hypothetical protein